MARKYKVLIVDDSTSVLKALARAFADTPYEIITCNDPVKSYEMIEDEHFDIVISDIMMPELDGLPCCARSKTTTAPSR